MSSHTRLTMKPFPEKPIDKVASTSICVRTELEANGGVSGGASHKFNAICHGRETAEITEIEKLQKSPKSRNCTNLCNDLTSAQALRCAEVKKEKRKEKAISSNKK